MTTHTADEFKHARFATHPDGRIAARVDPASAFPWSTGSSRRAHDWADDYNMAAAGWSPLDESRPFPRVVTDEEVLAALNAHSRHLYPGHTEQRTLIWWRAPAVGAMRRALTAALSAAPTADEDARTYALEQIEAAQAETTEAVTRAEKAEARAEKAVQDRDEYKDERDKYRAQAQLLATMYEDRLAADNTLTAREHLDAAIALMDDKR